MDANEPRESVPIATQTPLGLTLDGSPRKSRAGRPRGSKTARSLTDAAADATRRPAAGAAPEAAAPKKEGPCATCGQGDGPVQCSACGRETSPLTRESTNAIAEQYVGILCFLSAAIAGEKDWQPAKQSVDALRANAREAAWVYRTYLSEKMILGGLVVASVGIIAPAYVHRKAKAKAKAAAGANHGSDTIEPTIGGTA